MKLTTLYNEAIENPITFTTFDDDGRVTISAHVGRTNVGNIIVEQLMNVYWMFEDDMLPIRFLFSCMLISSLNSRLIFDKTSFHFLL